MVTLDKLNKNSELYKDVMKKIRTETYESKNKADDIHDHDGAAAGGCKELAENPGTTPQSSKEFMAKDANGNSGVDTKAVNKYKGFKHRLHDSAKRLALDATVDKLQKQKEENDKAKQSKPPQISKVNDEIRMLTYFSFGTACVAVLCRTQHAAFVPKPKI